jgi:hypothetical protein
MKHAALLEKRYARLLRVYSPQTREQRNGEELDTLLAVAQPDQSWPSYREARAIIAGGLTDRTLRRGATDLRSIFHEGARLAIPATFGVSAGFWMNQAWQVSRNDLGGFVALWAMMQLVIAVLWTVRPRRATLMAPALLVVSFLVAMSVYVMSTVGFDSFARAFAAQAIFGALAIGGWTFGLWKAIGPTLPKPSRLPGLAGPIVLALGSFGDLGRFLVALSLLLIPLVALGLGRVYPHLLMAAALTVLPILTIVSFGLWLLPHAATVAVVMTMVMLAAALITAVRMRSSLRYLAAQK